MARDGQKDRICHWLPLPLFIGMGLDTLLNLIEGIQEAAGEEAGKRGDRATVIPDRSKIFLKMIGPEAQVLMIKASHRG